MAAASTPAPGLTAGGVWDGNLSAGAAAAIAIHGQRVDRPVLQVLSLRRIEGKAQPQSDRWKLVLSDGIHHFMALAAASWVPALAADTVRPNAVMRLTDYTVTAIQTNKWVTVLSKAELLTQANGQPVEWQVGNPVDVATAGAPVGAAAAAVSSSAAVAPAAAAAPAYRAPVMSSNIGNNPSVPRNIVPIKSLNPYTGGGWTIKARVTHKGNTRSFTRNDRPGKVFDFDLLDSDGGEIRCSVWNAAVDALESRIEVGRVYYISKGRVGQANKRFTGSIQNEYELSLDTNSIVEQCPDDDGIIPTMHYAFVPLNRIPELTSSDVIDVLGIVIEAEPTLSVNTKNGQTSKKTLTILDSTNMTVQIALWGKAAEECGAADKSVLAAKGVKVSDWNGRSLSVLGSSQVTFNPELPAAHALRQWYDTEGFRLTPVPISTPKQGGGYGGGAAGGGDRATVFRHFGDVPNELAVDQKEYYSNRATVLFVKNDPQAFAYPACKGCKKRVIDSNGRWACENCRLENAEHEYNYILQVQLGDHTGNIWATAFSEAGEAIMGRPARELVQLRDSGNEAALKQAFKDAQFKKYMFRIRTKSDSFDQGGQTRTRIRSDIVTVPTPIDFVAGTRDLLAAINQAMGAQ